MRDKSPQPATKTAPGDYMPMNNSSDNRSSALFALPPAARAAVSSGNDDATTKPLRPKSPKSPAIKNTLGSRKDITVQATRTDESAKNPTDFEDFRFGSPDAALSPPMSPKQTAVGKTTQQPNADASQMGGPIGFQNQTSVVSPAQSPPQLLSPPSMRRQDSSKRVAFSPTQDEQPFDSTAPSAAVQVNIT